MGLYANWSSRALRARLYLNKKRRARNFPHAVKDAEWVVGQWYRIGDTVAYELASYRCAQNHTAAIGREPDTASTLWVETE